MPFSGSIFNLVAGNPVVTGTTISSITNNNTLSDIAIGLSQAYSSKAGSGGTGGTNDIGFFENDVFLGSSYTIGQNAYISIGGITNANPGVITTPAPHNLVDGNVVIFATTGALPTNLVAGTNYYVIATGLTITQFEVSATSGGTAIDCTAGAQSGVHTVAKLKNAVTAGPVTIGSGATITVPTGATWTVI